MKKKKNFIIAIIFSITFPILFGYIYLNYFNESNKAISKIDSKPEIIYENNLILENPEFVAIEDNDYKSAINYNFLLSYNNKQNTIGTYDIYLKGKFSQNQNILSCLNWKLEKYDYNLKLYKLVNYGNFASNQNEEILLNKQTYISDNELQKYRLYYYFVSNACIQDKKNIDLQMTIVVK